MPSVYQKVWDNSWANFLFLIDSSHTMIRLEIYCAGSCLEFVSLLDSVTNIFLKLTNKMKTKPEIKTFYSSVETEKLIMLNINPLCS